MFRRVLVVGLACGACIKLSGFHPLDGAGGGSDAMPIDARPADAAPPGECGNGGSDMATASMSGGAICMGGPGYALRFPAAGFGFPDQLRIGSAEVLGTTSACNEESLIGIEAYPVPRFAADSQPTGVTGAPSILLAGPVVAKVAVTWSWGAGSACASVPRNFSGTSTFTVFPDGRLVRYDKLTTPAATSQMPCDCGSQAQGFFVMSYLALDPARGPVVTDGSGTTYPPNTGHGADIPPLVCASGSDWGIGIAQVNGGRARTVTGGALSLTNDWDASGTTSLTAGTQEHVTAYQIGGAACAPLLSQISQFTMQTSPQLHVKNNMGFDDNSIGTQYDGMYGGYDGSSSGLPVGPGTLTLSATTGNVIPPGWALWVSGTTLKPPTANPTQNGEWYQIQNGSNDAIIWFRNGLSGSATIMVPTP